MPVTFTCSTITVGAGTGYLNVYSTSGYAETYAGSAGVDETSYVKVSISCLQNNGLYKTDTKKNIGQSYTTAWVTVSGTNFVSGYGYFEYYRGAVVSASTSVVV